MVDALTQLRKHLAEIPELTLEAGNYLTPGTAPADPDARYSTTIYRAPIVAEITDLLDIRDKDVEDPTENRLQGERRLGVLPTLGLWVSLIYPELEDMGHQPRECCPHRDHTVSGETRWLSDYAEYAIELHSDFAHDIELLWQELRRACRVRHPYKPHCNRCNSPVEGVYGDSEDETVGPAWWRCTGCGQTWVHDAEVQRLALTQPKMTLRQISRLVEIPLRTLYRWRDQGRFTRTGSDKRGDLFEIDHVRRAAQKLGKIPA